MTTSKVVPLRTCVHRIGPRMFRWFCWRCGRHASGAFVRPDTAIKHLDRHVHHYHRGCVGVPKRLEAPCS